MIQQWPGPGLDPIEYVLASGSLFLDGGNAGALTPTCSGGAWNVQYTNNRSGTTAELWFTRTSTGSTTYSTRAGIGVTNVILGATGTDHLLLRAQIGPNVTVWEMWVKSGACQMNISESRWS